MANAALINKLQDKFGKEFHPAFLLAEVVANNSVDQNNEPIDYDIKLRVDCAKTLMPYLEATKKSVEVKGQIDSNVGLLRVTMYESEEDSIVDVETDEEEQQLLVETA